MTVDVMEYAKRKARDSEELEWATYNGFGGWRSALIMPPMPRNPMNYMPPQMDIGDLYGEDARAAHEPNRKMLPEDIGLA